MSGLELSAGLVQRMLLEPAMDATALNRVQSRLLFDPSPEPDSLLELICVGLSDGADPWELRALQVGRELFAANRSEGDQVRTIAGTLDGWTGRLHGDELAGAQRGLGVKALAAAVRAPLGVLIAEFVDPLSAADAVRVVDAATAGWPRERLAAGSVRNALGPRKHELLLELFDRRVASC